jgi:hypothetical protein
MTEHETFSIITHPITDLALTGETEARLTAALDGPDKAAIAAALEGAINARLAESGWDGDWTAAEIVTEILDREDATTSTVRVTADTTAAEARLAATQSEMALLVVDATQAPTKPEEGKP